MAWTVVIAGGGFGGLYAARRLERRLPRHSAPILLVADANYMLYTPLLPGAAAAATQRPDPARRRRQLHALHAPAAGGGGRLAGAAPRRRAAAGRAPLDRHPPWPGQRRRSHACRAQDRDGGRPQRSDPLRPAGPRPRLGVASAAGAGPRRARSGLQGPG